MACPHVGVDLRFIARLRDYRSVLRKLSATHFDPQKIAARSGKLMKHKAHFAEH